MWYMVETLEVLKLSGWLNASARCRESKGRHTPVEDEVLAPEGGRRRTTAVQAACRKGLECIDSGQGSRTETLGASL